MGQTTIISVKTEHHYFRETCRKKSWSVPYCASVNPALNNMERMTRQEYTWSSWHWKCLQSQMSLTPLASLAVILDLGTPANSLRTAPYAHLHTLYLELLVATLSCCGPHLP